jgi:radical SAM superfamily enzyme YgiQ (UPF0313 family)
MSAQSKTPVYLVYYDKNEDYMPLALGLITEYIKVHKAGMLNGFYEFVPKLLTSPDVAREAIKEHGPGVFLSSDYLWSSSGNLGVTKLVKELTPDSIIIHGGPSVPKYEYSCEDFFRKYPFVDITVRGEGELTAAELLEQLATHPGDFAKDPEFLANTAGISYRQRKASGEEKIIRTSERERIQDLDILPSPYLTGYFRPDEVHRWKTAILETNRGCPYGCTFCDWGSATLSKIRKFSMSRVRAEIEYIAQQGAHMIWIADANWGIFPRDVEVAQTIAACRQKYGHPKAIVVNYAKHGTERIAEMIKILKTAGVMAGAIISIQTQDPGVLKNINRTNIRTQRYEELISVFRQNNLPVSSDVMIGLPGATVQTFKDDLQFFFDRKVFAKTYSTVMLPNSPMAHRDYVKKYEITTDEEGKILTTISYTQADRLRMDAINTFYEYGIGCSLLKYFLYYLQVDHDVKAIDFIEDLERELRERPSSMPHTSLFIEQLLNMNRRLTIPQRTDAEWAAFLDEIGSFAGAKYMILDEAMKTAMLFQRKLMPGTYRKMPERLEVPHDVVTYMRTVYQVKNIAELKQMNFKLLAEHGPGVLEITDPLDLCNKTFEPHIVDDHHLAWELTWGSPTEDPMAMKAKVTA